MAEGWIQVNQYGELLNPPIGIEAILSTLYAAFTFLSEGRRDENDKPRAPTFDGEPLNQFCSDWNAFIDDLIYTQNDLNCPRGAL